MRGNDPSNRSEDWVNDLHDSTLYNNGVDKPIRTLFDQAGWDTYTVGVSSGYQCSFEDALAWYDYIDQTIGGKICVYGRSAGAHLALLVASQRDTYCVIGSGTPTALNNLGEAPQFKTLPELAAQGSVHNSMGNISSSQRSFWSPVELAQFYPGIYNDETILLGAALDDFLINPYQTDRFENLSQTSTVAEQYIGSGSCDFTHANAIASCADVDQFTDSIYYLLN